MQSGICLLGSPLEVMVNSINRWDTYLPMKYKDCDYVPPCFINILALSSGSALKLAKVPL